jgi:hypothetical protein
MANSNFPGPSINRLLDSSPKIVRVPMESAEWGARKSAQPKNTKNDMTLSHVSNKG